MKSYTDITQSQKLAEILSHESADMCYRIVAHNPNDTHEYQPYCFVGTLESDIPCWSLSALLNILPHCIDERYDLVSGKLTNNKGWYVMYDDVDHFTRFYVTHSDLIDACIEMIVWLKENGKL